MINNNYNTKMTTSIVWIVVFGILILYLIFVLFTIKSQSFQESFVTSEENKCRNNNIIGEFVNGSHMSNALRPIDPRYEVVKYENPGQSMYCLLERPHLTLEPVMYTLHWNLTSLSDNFVPGKTYRFALWHGAEEVNHEIALSKTCIPINMPTVSFRYRIYVDSKWQTFEVQTSSSCDIKGKGIRWRHLSGALKIPNAATELEWNIGRFQPEKVRNYWTGFNISRYLLNAPEFPLSHGLTFLAVSMDQQNQWKDISDYVDSSSSVGKTFSITFRLTYKTNVQIMEPLLSIQSLTVSSNPFRLQIHQGQENEFTIDHSTQDVKPNFSQYSVYTLVGFENGRLQIWRNGVLSGEKGNWLDPMIALSSPVWSLVSKNRNVDAVSIHNYSLCSLEIMNLYEYFKDSTHLAKNVSSSALKDHVEDEIESQKTTIPDSYLSNVLQPVPVEDDRHEHHSHEHHSHEYQRHEHHYNDVELLPKTPVSNHNEDVYPKHASHTRASHTHANHPPPEPQFYLMSHLKNNHFDKLDIAKQMRVIDDTYHAYHRR